MQGLDHLTESMVTFSDDWFLSTGVPLLLLSGFLISLGFDIWEGMTNIDKQNRHGD